MFAREAMGKDVSPSFNLKTWRCRELTSAPQSQRVSMPTDIPDEETQHKAHDQDTTVARIET